MATLLIAVSAEILSAALQEALPRHRVYTCHTGTAALAQLDALRPDIFIVELCLPGLSGLEVLAKASCKPPVILALTSFVNDYVMQAAADAGVREMLLLPCSVAGILRHLEDFMEIPTPHT